MALFFIRAHILAAVHFVYIKYYTVIVTLITMNVFEHWIRLFYYNAKLNCICQINYFPVLIIKIIQFFSFFRLRPKTQTIKHCMNPNAVKTKNFGQIYIFFVVYIIAFRVTCFEYIVVGVPSCHSFRNIPFSHFDANIITLTLWNRNAIIVKARIVITHRSAPFACFAFWCLMPNFFIGRTKPCLCQWFN